MTGWSISLQVLEDEQRAETIRECFAYAEQKRAEYCADDQDLWLEGYRESSLDSLEDGEFFVNVPVTAAFADLIEWNDVVDLADDWVISGEAIDELIDLLQTAATELDQRDGPSTITAAMRRRFRLHSASSLSSVDTVLR